MRTKQWINAVGTGVILVWGLHGEPSAAVTETGGDDPITFTLPAGVPAFPVTFRSDILSGFFGESEATAELADILTVTFPGEAAKTLTGESGTLFQKGFVIGNKVDQVTVSDPGLLGGTSDFVALYLDTTTNKVAVGFTSCSVCLIPLDTVPEPATALVLIPGLAGLLGYRWMRRRKIA
jgi:hypothetical protein